MWKRILSLIFAFVFSLAALCFADQIPLGNDEASIGGVKLGSSMDYVRSIYGVPSGQAFGYDSFRNSVTIYNYGDTFYLYVYEGNGKSYINELLTTANNGLKTPMGVTVGMSEDEIFKIYGQKNPSSISYKTRVYEYVTKNGMHIDLTMKESKKVYYVSQIRMRFEG
jgi:hypothetical protein